MTRPCLRRSSGTNAMPARIGGPGSCAATPLPASADRAGVVAVDAEDGAGDLAAAGADEAGQADDLAGADLKVTSWKTPARVSPSTSSTTSPTSAGVLGYRSPTSRPTIRATISSTVVSATASVEM